MKQFPSALNVKNKNKFSLLYDNRVLCYLRKKIYEHIIKENENNYFDLDVFSKKHNVKNIENLIVTIIKELNNIGWKCKLSFGGTGLFIYSTDIPPSSCWDDGLI